MAAGTNADSHKGWHQCSFSNIKRLVEHLRKSSLKTVCLFLLEVHQSLTLNCDGP